MREFAALREANPVFSDVAALSFTLAGVGRDDDVRRSFVFFASDNLFSAARRPAGRRPLLRRRRGPPQRQPARGRGQLSVVAAPGRKPDFVGSTLKVNGQPFTVIGITPRGFTGINAVIAPDLWLPLGVYSRFVNPLVDNERDRDLANPASHPLNLMGRLRPGLTLAVGRSRCWPPGKAPRRPPAAGRRHDGGARTADPDAVALQHQHEPDRRRPRQRCWRRCCWAWRPSCC